MLRESFYAVHLGFYYRNVFDREIGFVVVVVKSAQADVLCYKIRLDPFLCGLDLSGKKISPLVSGWNGLSSHSFSYTRCFPSLQVQFNLQFTKPNTSLGDVHSGTTISVPCSTDKEK